MKTLRRLIREAIGDEYFGSLIAQLRDKPDLAITQDWLLYMGVEYLGEGQYRIVYSLPNDPMFVLKVAKGIHVNPKTDARVIVSKRAMYGSGDNLTEVKRFNEFPRVFPKAYVHAPVENIGGGEGVLWLIVEKVDVVGKSAQDLIPVLKKHMPVVYKFLIENAEINFLEGDINEQIKQSWYDLIFSMDAYKMGILNQSFGVLKTIFKRDFGETFDQSAIEYLVTNDHKFRDIYLAAEGIGMAYRELRGDNLGITSEDNLVIIDASTVD